jgi:hypothetical protein
MSTEYERQRELTISKNKELLDRLSLEARSPSRQYTSARRPPKRRKPEGHLPPLRTSSRLASRPQRSHIEEDENREPRITASRLQSSPSKVKSLTEVNVHDIVQQWEWQATSGLPTRDGDEALHFDGFNDVTPSISC